MAVYNTVVASFLFIENTLLLLTGHVDITLRRDNGGFYINDDVSLQYYT